ncbi:MAG: type II toxin-antitoxin system RelE/ParE family toxin [Anaerolineales bacterium]|nr:type II toxin-antitoxin system RelE/ParE family toxin [Anaerolineales bacterium]
MAYQVIIKKSVEKELDSLSAKLRERIIQRLLVLEENPRPQGVKKLQGEESYRLRIGIYRALYSIDDKKKEVLVYAIGHRREVYR